MVLLPHVFGAIPATSHTGVLRASRVEIPRAAKKNKAAAIPAKASSDSIPRTTVRTAQPAH